MKARALYERGDLDGAIAWLGQELRDDPMDSKRRIFLFELLAFAGEYDRAEKQLDVLARSGKEAEMGALLYRSALHAERQRDEMFRSGAFPQGDSGPPAVSGSVDGTPFDAMQDLDPRLGARLEVYAAGQYTWIPLEHISGIRIEAPKKLRDLLWLPAQILPGPRFSGMELGEVLIPAISPGSCRHPDPSVRLGREVQAGLDESGVDGLEVPFGPKLFAVDDDLIPLVEMREIRIDAAPADEGSSPDSE